MQRGQKIEAIQALRGVAVLAVVAFHSLLVERKYSGGDSLMPDWFVFGESGVDLFFVISGYVMVTVTHGRFGRIKEVTRFVWGRVTRIYPTYWFYFLLTLSVLMVKPNWVNTSLGEQSNLLASFLLLPTDGLPLVMVAWSLIHELWFYLVFAVLLLLPERTLLLSLSCWAAAVVAVNLALDLSALSPAARIMAHPYTCEFIIGSFGALLVRAEYISRVPSRLFWAVLMAVAVCLIQAGAAGVLGADRLNRALVLGTLYGALLAACVVLEARGSLRMPAFLRQIGDISYTVYLSHVLVLSAIGRLWVAIGPVNGLGDNVLACLAMITAVLLYGWIGYRLIEKPTLDLSRRLRTRLIG